MEGYNVASGSTWKPCGLIFDRLAEVEKKTETIMQNLPLHNNTTTNTFTTSQSKSSWEGGFTNLTTGFMGLTGGHQPPHDSHTTSSEVMEVVGKLQQQLKSMEDCVKSESVSIAGYAFGSFSETYKFVKEHVPNSISDGFHDIVTLLERCTDHYVDYSEGMSTQSQSSKAEYELVEKGENAYSYEIILPSVFGRRKVGFKESEYQGSHTIK